MNHFQVAVVIAGGITVIITSIGIVWSKVVKPLVEAAMKIKEGIELFLEEFTSTNGEPKFRQQFKELVETNREIAVRVEELENAQRENTEVVAEKLDHIGER